MKKLKYIIIFILSLGILNSCLIDDETDIENNDQGYNLAGFDDGTVTYAGIADGSEYTFYVEMALIGPTEADVTNDITVTIGVADESTGVEGEHFRIDNKTITLEAANNHLARIPFTMTTLGIVTPLAENPVVVLEVLDATGDANVIANGKKLTINLSFACPSFLAGDYNVVTTRGDGGVATWSETITEIGTGEYLTEYVGTWNPPLNSEGYGFIFYDLCDVITVPLQGLADIYSNDVWGHKEGSVNPDTGVITIDYTIWFAAGNMTYSSVYTPIP
jgi:hypothetical protein